MEIYKAITMVMSTIAPIGKGRTNTTGASFKFRGVDDVMNELQPALVAAKLFIVPEVLESTREERQTKSGGTMTTVALKMKFTFYAEDGSNVAAVVVGEAFDAGDKATNKAMSIGFKYACLQVFCIPTEDPKDPDAESPTVAPRTAPAAKPAPAKAQTPSPAAPPTRMQEFQKAMYDARLSPDEAKTAVFSVCDPFDYPTVKDAVVGVGPDGFDKILEAIFNAGVDKEAASA